MYKKEEIVKDSAKPANQVQPAIVETGVEIFLSQFFFRGSKLRKHKDFLQKRCKGKKTVA